MVNEYKAYCPTNEVHSYRLGIASPDEFHVEGRFGTIPTTSGESLAVEDALLQYVHPKYRAQGMPVECPCPFCGSSFVHVQQGPPCPPNPNPQTDLLLASPVAVFVGDSLGDSDASSSTRQQSNALRSLAPSLRPERLAPYDVVHLKDDDADEISARVPLLYLYSVQVRWHCTPATPQPPPPLS